MIENAKLCDYFDENCKKLSFAEKELSLWHNPKISNPYIIATWWCKPLILDLTEYLRSTTLVCKDIGIRKSEFVVKTQLFY